MSTRRFLLATFLACLAGCDSDRSAGGGGIETGDLQAVAVSRPGVPVSAARIWLVRGHGDTAPATIIDSGLSGSDGAVHFRVPEGVASSSLGLDARRGDLMAALPGIGRDRSTVEVCLRPSGTIEAWIDSTRTIPAIYLPGSHFSSFASSLEPKSVLRLPLGDWRVAVSTARKTDIVEVDLGGSPVRVGAATPWSTKPLVWSDSLVLHATFADSLLFRDTSLPPTRSWRILDTTSATAVLSASLATARSDTIHLATRLDAQIGSGSESPLLPDSGGVSFRFANPKSLDSSSLRSIQIEDSARSGRLKILVDPNKPEITYVCENVAVAFHSDSIGVRNLANADWNVLWNRRYFYIFANRALVASSNRPGAPGAGVRIQVASLPRAGIPAASADLSGARLYQNP